MSKLFALLTFLCPIMLLAQSFPSNQIQEKMDASIDDKRIFGVVISIGTEDSTYHFAAGNMDVGDAYFIASVSKMYTTSVLYKLVDQGKVNLDDPISNYLSDEILNGLHVYKNEEYTRSITIRHLVTNTSGLSDYFMQKNKGEKSLSEYLVSEGDTSLTFDQMMASTKQLPAQFPPGTEGKAHYSDGNFQLLGKMIEKVTGKSMQEVYQEFIFDPLELEKTYLYNDPKDTIPAKFYYKENLLNIPNMMTCFQSDGGIVSTTEENLIFLKAQLNGELYSEAHLKNNSEWNKIYSPFQYGYGLMKFKFFGMPDMIGHAGANGSFAYYVPSRELYITGTINQMDKPQLAYKLIARILATIKD